MKLDIKKVNTILYRFIKDYPDVDFSYKEPYVHVFMKQSMYSYQVLNLQGVSDAINHTLNSFYDGEYDPEKKK